MKLVERAALNEAKWNEWLAKEPIAIFSSLTYLDQIAESIRFVLNDQETGGMALPVRNILGVQKLYSPKFMRYITWIGEDVPNEQALQNFLQSEFSIAEVFVQTKIMGGFPAVKIHQQLDEPNLYRSQAKRRIKDALKAGFTVEESNQREAAFELTKAELLPRVQSLESDDFARMNQLTESLYTGGQLKVLVLKNAENQPCGYLFILLDNQFDIFLKGTCEGAAKKKGGMYLLMDHAIQAAFESGKQFDFGGSRVEGVRKFNRSFGSKDVNYFQYAWNDAPLPFRLIKYFRDKWIKK